MHLCIPRDEFLISDNPEKAVSQNKADIGACTVQWFCRANAQCSARTMTQLCDNVIQNIRHFVELNIHRGYDLEESVGCV